MLRVLPEAESLAVVGGTGQPEDDATANQCDLVLLEFTSSMVPRLPKSYTLLVIP